MEPGVSFHSVLGEVPHRKCCFSAKPTGTGPDMVHEASDFWTRFARKAERESQGASECLVHPNVPSRGGDFERRSSKLVQKVQQARRMSAVAKIFSRSVETGAINASVHVKGGAQDNAELAVASVDAVAKVVEAVETAGRTFTGRNHRAGTDLRHRILEKEEGKRAAEGRIDVAVESLFTSAWTLNKLGLHMLFRTIASIHSKSNIRSYHSGSSWSTEGGSRLRLSSSASLSSVSRLSPSASLSSASSRSPSEVPSRKAENASPTQVETMSRLSNMRPSPAAEMDSQAQLRWVSSRTEDRNNVAAIGTEGLCRPMAAPARLYVSELHLQVTQGDGAYVITKPSVGQVQQPQLPSSVQTASPSQAQCPFEPAPRPYQKRPI